MARFFHPACDLTFALPDGVVVVPSADFCERVAARWSMELHRPWAHLRDDPRAAACDSLVSVDFAGPGVCRAVLRIGYPPFLYTDVLLLLRLGAECEGRPGGSWWIVAKSSGNVPLLREEARHEAARQHALHEMHASTRKNTHGVAVVSTLYVRKRQRRRHA